MEKKNSAIIFKILIVIALNILSIAVSLTICSIVSSSNRTNDFYVHELNEWEKEHLTSEKVIYELTYEFDGYDDYTINGEETYCYNGKYFTNILKILEG